MFHRWDPTYAALVVILESLDALHRKVERLLMNEQDLQVALDGIKAGVTTVVDRLTAQAKTISDLTAQVAAGTPVSQDQLDALTTEAQGIVAALAPHAQ